MNERLVTLGMIVAAVETATGLIRREILSERRNPEVAHARFTIWWLATKLTVHSLPEIGEATNRDHSTVLLGVKRAEELRAADLHYRAATDTLLTALLALEHAGVVRLANAADPIFAARRIMSSPAREAVRVSTAEIIAMSQLLVALHGSTDAPMPSPLSAFKGA